MERYYFTAFAQETLTVGSDGGIAPLRRTLQAESCLYPGRVQKIPAIWRGAGAYTSRCFYPRNLASTQTGVLWPAMLFLAWQRQKWVIQTLLACLPQDAQHKSVRLTAPAYGKYIIRQSYLASPRSFIQGGTSAPLAPYPRVNCVLEHVSS